MIFAEDNVRAILDAQVQRAGSQDAAAKRLGISSQYLCDVLKGRRAIGAKLLKALGMKRVVMYERY